jgi:hypothetical protein
MRNRIGKLGPVAHHWPVNSYGHRGRCLAPALGTLGGELALRLRYHALENRQRLYYIHECDLKARKSICRLRLGRLTGHAGSGAGIKGFHSLLGLRRLFLCSHEAGLYHLHVK